MHGKYSLKSWQFGSETQNRGKTDDCRKQSLLKKQKQMVWSSESGKDWLGFKKSLTQ